MTDWTPTHNRVRRGLHDDAIGFGEFLSVFHGRDERVSVSSVDLATELLKTVLDGFAADPGGV